MKQDEFDRYLTELRERRISEAEERRRRPWLVKLGERVNSVVGPFVPLTIVALGALALVLWVGIFLIAESTRSSQWVLQ